jgi:flagellar secretion chaperone FliS
MNPYASANQAYTESSILTASPEQLVVMLYDGAIRFLNQAATALRAGNRQQFAVRLRRAEAIISELNLTLDMERGGDVAVRLRSIYMFSRRHLIEAQLKSDPQRVDQVVALLSELRESWAGLVAAPGERAAAAG